MEDVRGPDGGKVQVMEQGGASMVASIQNKDPFRQPECRWKEECLVNKKEACMENNLVYQIKCSRCGDDNQKGLYIGQTGGSIHRRQKEHLQGLKRGDWKCPLFRHTRQHHPEGAPDFIMEKISKARSNMERLVYEAELIGNHDDGGSQLWNQKGEYGRSKLVRLKSSSEYV